MCTNIKYPSDFQSQKFDYIFTARYTLWTGKTTKKKSQMFIVFILVVFAIAN